MKNKPYATKRELEEHKKKYIYIPLSWPRMGRFLFFLLSGYSVYLHLKFLIYIAKINNFFDLFLLDVPQVSNSHLTIVPVIIFGLIFAYSLVSLTVISLAAFIKGGFNKLKEIEEEALIGSFIFFPFRAITPSLLIGAVMCILTGIASGWVHGLLLGIVAAFLTDLMLSLMALVSIGLGKEFDCLWVISFR